MAQVGETVPRQLTSGNLSRRLAWRRRRREAVAARKAALEELQNAVPPSAQEESPVTAGIGLKRKRLTDTDEDHHSNETALAPGNADAPYSDRQDCESSSSVDDLEPYGLPTTLVGMALIASQAQRAETGLPPTPESIDEEIDVDGSTLGTDSPESGDEQSRLDDRLLSIAAELPEQQILRTEASDPNPEDDSATSPTESFEGDEPTELILADLSQKATQHHTDAEAESFLPPDSTALWIEASSQVERAEESFFGSGECQHSCNPPRRKFKKEQNDLLRGRMTSSTRVLHPPKESYEEHSRRCTACDVETWHERAILCGTCALTPGADVDLEDVIDETNLCAVQADILRLASQGHNIFYTGAAGTGKSTVLRAMVRYFRAHEKDVEVVSPTGITALNVNGRTIHSFAAWGSTVDERPASKVRSDAGRQRVYEKLRRLEVLIIDEISMVSSNTMTRLESVLQHVKGNNRPFGDVQVIITGDLYQLPPVKPFYRCHDCGLETQWRKEKPKEWICAEHGIFHDDDKWAFRSQTWDDLKLRCKQLMQIHRQSDPTFMSLLNKCRVGELTLAEENLLWNHDNNVEEDAIRIYPRRDMVNKMNNKKRRNLEGPETAMRCVDSWWWNEDKDDFKRYDLAERWERVRFGDEFSPFVSFTKERHRYDETFRFKRDMPVVLLANLFRFQEPGLANDSQGKAIGLANGSQGKIIGFEPYRRDKLPRARRNDKDEHTLEQWIFFGDHGWYQEAEIAKFCSQARPSEMFWPVVKFQNGITATIYPYCAVHEIGAEEPYSLMSRTQIPLLAAWAITTHKSQGMTLDQADIDMSSAWEHGQMYTAMSRVRTLEGLKISGVPYGKASRADSTVQQFMDETTWI